MCQRRAVSRTVCHQSLSYTSMKIGTSFSKITREWASHRAAADRCLYGHPRYGLSKTLHQFNWCRYTQGRRIPRGDENVWWIRAPEIGLFSSYTGGNFSTGILRVVNS
jgi:hypothetical protein